MPEAQLQTPTTAEILEEKIRTRAARVGIVGLGYVGLPLAVEFAKAGFAVSGIDASSISRERSVAVPRPPRSPARRDIGDS